ncbi:LysE family translocator [Vibrio maritimus]|uniref:LysE family translocator n=1 Tax=Vibrio maritimus TaxID=990268 RepID=UPI001F15CA17|nr:LysE family translocator [Vibrio maritimus]
MESQLAFITICIASAASPGPGMLAVLSNSLNQNMQRTIPVILGISTGLLLASILSNSWLLTLVHTNDLAYQVMTGLCSSYIIYLGGRAIYYSRSQAMIEERSYGYRSGVLISLLNPKTIVFFGALFPLFVKGEQYFALQAAVLTLELILITLSIHLLLSLATEKVARFLKRHIVIINRLTGVLFILLGTSGLLL